MPGVQEMPGMQGMLGIPIPVGHFAQTQLLRARRGCSSPPHRPRFILDRGTSGVWDLHLCLEPGLVANLLK